ncbi:hypothetical protein FHT69_003796 [Rhizobium sp. BK008]|nr:hypothetical protein [Rhizobium sp. BK008]
MSAGLCGWRQCGRAAEGNDLDAGMPPPITGRSGHGEAPASSRRRVAWEAPDRDGKEKRAPKRAVAKCCSSALDSSLERCFSSDA